MHALAPLPHRFTCFGQVQIIRRRRKSGEQSFLPLAASIRPCANFQLIRPPLEFVGVLSESLRNLDVYDDGGTLPDKQCIGPKRLKTSSCAQIGACQCHGSSSLPYPQDTKCGDPSTTLRGYLGPGNLRRRTNPLSS